MANRLLEMRTFARAARLESFSGAARELRTSTTSVSRRIGDLEAALGVRLLERTTRRLSLTDVGRAYLTRCERILEDVADLEDAVSSEHATPRGTLRIAAGVSFAQEQLAPLLAPFAARHPDVELELQLADRAVDLVASNVDVAVRIGRLADSALIARRLAPSRLVLCGSPAYLEQRSLPDSLDALAGHDLLIDTNQPRSWSFENDTVAYTPNGRLRVDNAHAVLRAARDGMGIGLVPSFVAGPALERGEITRVLPELEPTPAALYAVYPQARHLSAKVRLFIDFMIERFGDPPAWDAALDPR